MDEVLNNLHKWPIIQLRNLKVPVVLVDFGRPTKFPPLNNAYMIITFKFSKEQYPLMLSSPFFLIKKGTYFIT